MRNQNDIWSAFFIIIHTIHYTVQATVCFLKLDIFFAKYDMLQRVLLFIIRMYYDDHHGVENNG